MSGKEAPCTHAAALRPSDLVSQKTKSEERVLKNYKDSNYALNKYSAGIVYRFADGSKATYTLADFLAENPGKTEDDFRALKEISDGIYLNQVTAENAQTKKNTSLDKLSGSKRYTPSPEDLHISAINAFENFRDSFYYRLHSFINTSKTLIYCAFPVTVL
jgi:hypothetical protein